MEDFRVLKRITKGGLTSLICLLPLLSMHWNQVLAETYDPFDPVLDSVNGNGASSGQAIVDTCRTGDNGQSEDVANQKFQDDCNLIVGSASNDPDGVAGALNALAADQVSAQNSASVRRNKTNTSVVGSRMQLLRVSSGVSAYNIGDSFAGNLLFNDALGGGASADSEYGKLGLFFNGRFVSGDEDSDKFQDGFDFDVWDLMAGADYRLSHNLIAGVALNYSEGDIDYDNSRGFLDTEAWGILAYTTYFLDNGLFFEGQMGYTDVDFSMERHVFYTIGADSANQRIKSSPDGNLFSMSLGVGKSYSRDSWSFSPSLRFDYLENDIDGYTEKSSNLLSTGGAMALAVNSANYESLTSNLGIQIATARNFSGGVLVPQIRVDWVHEFKDDSVGIKANYQNDINRTEFKIGTTPQDSDYFDVSIGLSAQLPNGKSGFISYRTLQGYDGLSFDSIQVGLRIELN